MPKQLCISVRFIDGAFHGRGDYGEPEWPPSPLRLYQAIVAASAAGKKEIASCMTDALHWLEQLPPPEIIASRRTENQPRGYNNFVPNNAGDLVAGPWSNGKAEVSIAEHRTSKSIRPTTLETPANGFAAVHYAWTFDDAAAASLTSENREQLLAAIRSVTHLGWGIDLVVADAAWNTTDAVPSGDMPEYTGCERWQPSGTAAETFGSGASLRVPVAGTLNDLKKRHATFLNRINIETGVFTPVPPPSQFRAIAYRQENEIDKPPATVFALRKPDDSGFAAFDPVRRGLHLNDMLRHAASAKEFTRVLGWDDARAKRIVFGQPKAYDDACQIENDMRLIFIPLPSLEWRGNERGMTAGAIRRVLMTVKGNCNRSEFSRIVRSLEGAELIDEQTSSPIAFLHRKQTDNCNAIKGYLGHSRIWVSVTPVILPGYDDPRKLRRRLAPRAPTLTTDEKTALLQQLDTRIDRLLRKALLQSDISDSIVNETAINWRGSGFLPGTDWANRYYVPDQHRRYRRLHVRLTFPYPISGPLCIGSGRYSGNGLFTAMPNVAFT